MFVEVITLILFTLVERSSTRLHAPPGGVSSICFGDYTPSNAQKQPAAISQPTSNKIAPKADPISEGPAHMRKAYHQSSMGGGMMANLMGDENKAPVTGRRIQHPPGGRSSIVIG